jgi:hypothetical protein
MAKKNETKVTKPAAEVKQPLDNKTKEIRWTPAKQALIKALRKLDANKATKAVGFEQIVKAAGIEEKQIKHQLNPKWDITEQEFIIRVATEEGFKWYLGTKGVKVKFDEAK